MGQDIKLKVDDKELAAIAEALEEAGKALRDADQARRDVLKNRGEGLASRGQSVRQRAREGFGRPGSVFETVRTRLGGVPLIGGLAAGFFTVQQVQEVVKDAIEGRSFNNVLRRRFTDFIKSLPFIAVVVELIDRANQKEQQKFRDEAEDRRRLGDLSARLQADPDFRNQAARIADREFKVSRESEREQAEAQERSFR